MGQASFWVMSIIAPMILLIVLIWLVLRPRSNRSSNETEDATRDVYAEEEQRRRDRTDQL